MVEPQQKWVSPCVLRPSPSAWHNKDLPGRGRGRCVHRWAWHHGWDRMQDPPPPHQWECHLPHPTFPKPSPPVPRDVSICAQSLNCVLTLCGPKDCSPPGSYVQGTLQARTLEWAAIPFNGRGSSRPRDRTHISHVGRQTPLRTHSQSEQTVCYDGHTQGASPPGAQRQLSGREERLCWGRAEGVRKEERNGFQAEVTRAKVRRRGGLPPREC